MGLCSGSKQGFEHAHSFVGKESKDDGNFSVRLISRNRFDHTGAKGITSTDGTHQLSSAELFTKLFIKSRAYITYESGSMFPVR